MAVQHQQYSVEQEIAEFFAKTSTTRSACELRAKDLVGGDVVFVPIQGNCSYTVYAGSEGNSVVQFRLKSLALPLTMIELAHRVYGSLVPQVDFKGQIGSSNEADKEALLVYVMPRLKGISRLEFVLASGLPEDSLEVRTQRLTLVTDIARFFALSWKSAIKLDHGQLEKLRRVYEKDLNSLLYTLPERFHPSIQECLSVVPSIMSLPTVLTHKDFGDLNLLVDPETCNLLGVIDWAEAEIEPFGINLYTIEKFMGKFHLRNGFIKHIDYQILHDTFWNTLRDEVGGWSEGVLDTIHSAMILGLLRSRGFTSRLANRPDPVPISDDESGAYNLLYLHSHLVEPNTRFTHMTDKAMWPR